MIGESSQRHHRTNPDATIAINNLAMKELAKDTRMIVEIGMVTGQAIPGTHTPIGGTTVEGTTITTAIVTVTTDPQSPIVYTAMRCTLGPGETDIASLVGFQWMLCAPSLFEA